MLPQLLHYHNIFYQNSLTTNRLVKIIPSNIVEWISPIVLAHLIMGDGNLKKLDQIIRIYTNSFTKSEVELLAQAITQKLGIVAKATHDRNDQFMITISKSQLPLVIDKLKVYMHPSTSRSPSTPWGFAVSRGGMGYKLGLLPEECVSDVEQLNLAELKDFGSDCLNYDEILKNLG